MKPIDLLFALPVIITIAALYMKAYYSTLLYSRRRGVKIGLIQYVQTLQVVSLLFPLLKKPTGEKERILIKKANRCIFLFYLMLIILTIEVVFVDERSELFK